MKLSVDKNLKTLNSNKINNANLVSPSGTINTIFAKNVQTKFINSSHIISNSATINHVVSNRINTHDITVNDHLVSPSATIDILKVHYMNSSYIIGTSAIISNLSSHNITTNSLTVNIGINASFLTTDNLTVNTATSTIINSSLITSNIINASNVNAGVLNINSLTVPNVVVTNTITASLSTINNAYVSTLLSDISTFTISSSLTSSAVVVNTGTYKNFITLTGIYNGTNNSNISVPMNYQRFGNMVSLTFYNYTKIPTYTDGYFQLTGLPLVMSPFSGYRECAFICHDYDGEYISGIFQVDSTGNIVISKSGGTYPYNFDSAANVGWSGQTITYNVT